MEPILLTRPGPDVPWGFRLQGGTDQQKPLLVQRVTPGSLASIALVVGEEILRIGNEDTNRLTYADAMEIIKSCGDKLELYISRKGTSHNSEPFSINHHSSSVSTDAINVERKAGANGVSFPHHQPSSPLAGIRNSPAAAERGNDLGRPKTVESLKQRQEPVRQAPARQAPMTQAPITQAPEEELNIATRTAHDKKPWTYAPDMQSLQQQRRRVQRRNFAPAKEVASGQFISPQFHRSHPSNQVPSRAENGQMERDDVSGYDSESSRAKIPSKTFQRLQSLTSSPNDSGNEGLIRAAQRRQRRRENLNTTDNSFADGTDKSQEFDEAAYLAGRIPILGSPSSKYVSTPRIIETSINNYEEQENDNQKPFDEKAYLAGRIPLVKGGPIDPTLFHLPTDRSSSPTSEEAANAERDDENEKPFDERAYLAGRIPLVRGGPIDPAQFAVPERRVVKRYKQVSHPVKKEPFDERAYLAGKLNLLGQTNDRSRIVQSQSPSVSKPEDLKPSWCKKDDQMMSEDEYDEESFLKGRIAIVRQSIDRDVPRRVYRDLESPKQCREPEQLERDGLSNDDRKGGTCSEPEFDEAAFLAGRWRRHLATDKAYSTDTETDIPSRTYHVLRRSESRERSTDKDWRSSDGSGLPSEDELGSDQEKPFDVYMYHGRKIPSKIFSRLKKTMDRKAASEKRVPSADPIERLKEKAIENIGIDVDTAMERLEIGKHDPDTYMEILKQSIEQNNIQIEPENEVTDF